MWKKYRVELQITGSLGGSLPRTRDEIQKMLENRMPKVPPENYVPITELTDVVADEVAVDEEEFLPGWATFKRDENGIYFEGRSVRGHIKDCALQVANYLNIKAFKAKVANKVYVMTDKIRLGKNEPDGTEQRFIQVMTKRGPRSTIKFIDWIDNPRLEFVLYVLDDGVIQEKHLETIFEYGSVHGIGQERSQGWGRYTYEITAL